MPSHHLFILLTENCNHYILILWFSKTTVRGQKFLIENFALMYKPCLHYLKTNVYFFLSFLQQVNIAFKMSF